MTSLLIIGILSLGFFQLSISNCSFGWWGRWTRIQFGYAIGRRRYILFRTTFIEKFGDGRWIAIVCANYRYINCISRQISINAYFNFQFSYLNCKVLMLVILPTRIHHKSIWHAVVVHDRRYVFYAMVLRYPKWLCPNCPVIQMPYGRWKNVLMVSI